MKRVLIITYYWPPSGGAGVQRWLKFVKYLPEFGWEPVVIAPNPDIAAYPLRDDSLLQEVDKNTQVIHTHDFNFFNFYKKLSGEKNIPYGGFASDSGNIPFSQKIGRFIRGNFFLPDPRKGWIKYAFKTASDFIASNKVDCVVTTGPPHSSHLTGLKLKKKFGLKWLADFRDPWTDIFYYTDFYPTKLAHLQNLRMEKSVIQKADEIITVSPSWKQLFESKGAARVSLITNGYDPENFTTVKKPAAERFIITYIGTMSDIYPIDAFLEAFEAFIEEHPTALFRFIGSISSGLHKRFSGLPDRNFEYIPYVPHQDVPGYLQEASVLLLLIPEHKSSKGIIPGKLFEYLAMGVPVLVIGPGDGDAAQIVRDSNSGAAVDNSETKQVYELLDSWQQSKTMITNDGKYTRKNLTKNLTDILNRQVSD
jgi:glycosyltransferase involved in cell wall biosynthesis